MDYDQWPCTTFTHSGVGEVQRQECWGGNAGDFQKFWTEGQRWSRTNTSIWHLKRIPPRTTVTSIIINRDFYRRLWRSWWRRSPLGTGGTSPWSSSSSAVLENIFARTFKERVKETEDTKKQLTANLEVMFLFHWTCLLLKSREV